MKKYLKYISLVIGLFGAYFFARILMVGSINQDRLEAGDTVATEKMEKLSGIVEGFINTSYVILIIIALIVLFFTVTNLLKNPKALKKALVALAVLAVVYAISYAVADGTGFDIRTAAGVEEVTEGTSKLVSTGIWFSIILGAVAFFGFIFDTVKTLVKQ